ncbi:peptide-methionine (S)-S-oxide reductase MsrA [Nitrospinaceae bacterium]|jgi:peptide-methionine (S)-S-oxide reductase|nr:peptide-methionine (S)-S-oxide reductase MsrA [Nitrospinaceae bacterium]
MATAIFGAGCFWGIEVAFGKVKGVTSTSVGYTGGATDNPTYEQVCTGKTNHAEVVWVEFDPSSVSYEELLDVFWGCHDPTTLNRQGPDRGTQYRSVIYFADPAQEAAAIKSKEQNSGRFPNPIVTEITAESKYYIAEDYHQQYLAKRGLENCH